MFVVLPHPQRKCLSRVKLHNRRWAMTGELQTPSIPSVVGTIQGGVQQLVVAISQSEQPDTLHNSYYFVRKCRLLRGPGSNQRQQTIRYTLMMNLVGSRHRLHDTGSWLPGLSGYRALGKLASGVEVPALLGYIHFDEL